MAVSALRPAVDVGGLRAQGRDDRIWNDSATLALVDRAVARRTAQLADSGLVDYRAVARGYLTFLAQLGEGFADPPEVVRADELAVEVYWRAPNQSKQRIIGRRDTLLLPTDIVYHRDHLAIVQNNFPAIIRLGDGDEVRDVPHPLSPTGQREYDFSVADSIRLRVGSRSWDVIELEVRPKDERAARIAGAFYLDRETASVVRIAAGFTRAALRDPALEDVSIVLDNSLVDGRFWLPRRQQIEIRRTGTWLEFPARGIIRGEWDLCCVEANTRLAAEWFAGPEIISLPPQRLREYPFAGAIMDSVSPRLAAAGAAGVAGSIETRLRGLLTPAAVLRPAVTGVRVSRLSDFAQFNRVEGLALGAGASRRFSTTVVDLRARYGFADARAKWRFGSSWPTRGGPLVSLRAFDEFREAGEPEVSRVANSFAAQEAGYDHTDDYGIRGLRFSAAAKAQRRWEFGIEAVRERPLIGRAKPQSGDFRAPFAASPGDRVAADVRFTTTRQSDDAGWTAKAEGTARVSAWRSEHGLTAGPGAPEGDGAAWRPLLGAGLAVTASRGLGGGRALFRAQATVATGDAVPAQDKARFGGPRTAPGFGTHALAANAGAGIRAEWALPLAGIPVRLGRFGAIRIPLELAPFGTIVALGSDGRVQPAGAVSAAWGAGLLAFGDTFRVDIARSVGRHGRWAVWVDAGRALWPIL